MAHANASGRLLPVLMISAAMLAACGQIQTAGKNDDGRAKTTEADDQLAAIRDEEKADKPDARARAPMPLAPAGGVVTEAAIAAPPP